VCAFDEQVYAVDAATPSKARRFAVERLHATLDRIWAQPAIDDVGLVVSELVTNAVNAGARTVAVDLAVHRGYVRLAVADDAAGRPVPQSPSTRETGGRGLHIVDQLSRGWGYIPTPGGKEVWAEVAVDPKATGTLSCSV
jgi:anti-sigma regulatory factor (Ser/Thr protein kinase)